MTNGPEVFIQHLQKNFSTHKKAYEQEQFPHQSTENFDQSFSERWQESQEWLKQNNLNRDDLLDQFLKESSGFLNRFLGKSLNSQDSFFTKSTKLSDGIFKNHAQEMERMNDDFEKMKKENEEFSKRVDKKMAEFNKKMRPSDDIFRNHDQEMQRMHNEFEKMEKENEEFSKRVEKEMAEFNKNWNTPQEKDQKNEEKPGLGSLFKKFFK